VKQYEEWTEDAAEAQAAEAQRLSGGGTYKLAAGKNVLRFLPPKVGMKSPFVTVTQHYLEAGQKKVSFVCPRMAKRQCPACEHADKLSNSGLGQDFEVAKQFNSKLRFFGAVVDRANEELGPQVFPFGKQIHDQLNAIRRDATIGGNFTHPDDGFDIVITRVGTGMQTEYTVAAARNQSPLHQDPAVAGDWLERSPNLARYALVPNPEQLKRTLGAVPEFGAMARQLEATAARAPRNAGDDAVAGAGAKEWTGDD
jgi:hypothetical protein